MKRLWPEFLDRIERLDLGIDDRKRCFANVRDVIETTGSDTIDDNAEHAFFTTTRYASYIYVALSERVVETTKQIYADGERWTLPSMVSHLNRVTKRNKERTLLRLLNSVDRDVPGLTQFALETIGPCFKPLIEEIVVDQVAALNKKKKKTAAIVDEKVYYLRKFLKTAGLTYTEKKTTFHVALGRGCVQLMANGKSPSYGIIDGVSSNRLTLDEFDRYAAFAETGMATMWQRDDAPRLSKLKRTDKLPRRPSSSRIDAAKAKPRGSTSSSSSERSNASETPLLAPAVTQ